MKSRKYSLINELELIEWQYDPTQEWDCIEEQIVLRKIKKVERKLELKVL